MKDAKDPALLVLKQHVTIDEVKPMCDRQFIKSRLREGLLGPIPVVLAPKCRGGVNLFQPVRSVVLYRVFLVE